MIKINDKVLKFIISIVGYLFIAMGVTLCLTTAIGTDPVSVFGDGLSKKLGISFGITAMVINGTAFIFVLIFGRKYINISTITTVVLIGPIIDVFISVVGKFLTPDINLVIKIILCIIGCVSLAFGLALYICADIGVGPTDILSEVFSEKTHIKYGVVRMCVDFTFMSIGFWLGGTVGIGTVFTVILTGPLVQFFKPRCTMIRIKVIEKFGKQKIEEDQIEEDISLK